MLFGSSMPVRARLLGSASLALAGAVLFGPAAFAQQTAAVETVVVTGSRLPSTFEAPTPVTVVDATQIRLSGSVNIEDTLNETPQFRGSQGDGRFANGQASGGATLNLRGLGAQRNLVLVNGRRYTIQGPDQTTDVNTIPTALVSRTEIVTGGSSAVYGSDAITGVVNFIMRQDFEGVEAQTHVDFDSTTMTPSWSADLTAGANFAGDRGNIAVSFGYQNRGGISRQDRGGIYIPPLGDGCVTAATASSRTIGTQITGVSGQACLNAGGVPGLVFAGSSDIPNGRFQPGIFPNTAQSNAGLNAAFAAAGLSGLSATASFVGYTYNDAGTQQRLLQDPADRYNLTLPNYLQIPQERWMINSFAHYDLMPHVTAYAEMHFSTNTVVSRLSPSNANGSILFDTSNPYVTPEMRNLFAQLDAAEPLTTPAFTAGAKTYQTTRGDGRVQLSYGRRFTDVGFRIANAQRDAWRFVGGFRGDLPNVSDTFLKDLSYDIYYNYAKTTNTERQQGSISRSRLQDAVLSAGGGAAPVCDIFGQNITTACVNAIAVNSTTVTTAQMAGAQGSITGSLFDLPAGPVAFALGGEWRATAAQFVPDQFLASGDVAGFNAALPTKGSESVREVFGEARVPLIKDTPMIQQLSVNGAFRISDYNLKGVGTVTTFSLGSDWKLDNNISFRGQYQSAIRAPSVGELFGGQSQGFLAFTDPCAVAANATNAAIRSICTAQGVPANVIFTPAVQPAALVGNVTGGNPNLSQEQSETITFGMVLTPEFIPGLAVSVDWFSIGINGAIAPLGGGLVNTGSLCFTTLQDANSIYCKAFNRDPGTGVISAPLYVQVTNANTGAAKTQGLDLEAQYHTDLGFGYLSQESSLSLAANYTWTTEFTLTPVKELSTIKNECVGSFGPTCGSPIPSLKGVTRATWTDGDVSLTLRHRFVGGVTDDRYNLPFRKAAATPALNTLTNPIIPDFHYLDISASYNVTDEIRLDAGVNNVLNVGPPVVGGAANGNVTFPATYDPLGQTFFFNVTLRPN